MLFIMTRIQTRRLQKKRNKKRRTTGRTTGRTRNKRPSLRNKFLKRHPKHSRTSQKTRKKKVKGGGDPPSTYVPPPEMITACSNTPNCDPSCLYKAAQECSKDLKISRDPHLRTNDGMDECIIQRQLDECLDLPVPGVDPNDFNKLYELGGIYYPIDKGSDTYDVTQKEERKREGKEELRGVIQKNISIWKSSNDSSSNDSSSNKSVPWTRTNTPETPLSMYYTDNWKDTKCAFCLPTTTEEFKSFSTGELLNKDECIEIMRAYLNKLKEDGNILEPQIHGGCGTPEDHTLEDMLQYLLMILGYLGFFCVLSKMINVCCATDPANYRHFRNYRHLRYLWMTARNIQGRRVRDYSRRNVRNSRNTSEYGQLGEAETADTELGEVGQGWQSAVEILQERIQSDGAVVESNVQIGVRSEYRIRDFDGDEYTDQDRAIVYALQDSGYPLTPYYLNMENIRLPDFNERRSLAQGGRSQQEDADDEQLEELEIEKMYDIMEKTKTKQELVDIGNTLVEHMEEEPGLNEKEAAIHKAIIDMNVENLGETKDSMQALRNAILDAVAQLELRKLNLIKEEKLAVKKTDVLSNPFLKIANRGVEYFTDEENTCPICQEQFDSANNSLWVAVPCGHLYHLHCLVSQMYSIQKESDEDLTCAVCRGDIKEIVQVIPRDIPRRMLLDHQQKQVLRRKAAESLETVQGHLLPVPGTPDDMTRMSTEVWMSSKDIDERIQLLDERIEELKNGQRQGTEAKESERLKNRRLRRQARVAAADNAAAAAAAASAASAAAASAASAAADLGGLRE